MDSHFIAYMYRLRYIERWSLMRNTTRENVAEHSYHVALLAHMLCEIGNRIFGRSLNADRAATMALFHDATEVFTGDIPTPVKHHNPKMLTNFREIEALAAERLLDMVPGTLQPSYESLVLGPAAKHRRNRAQAAEHRGESDLSAAAEQSDREGFAGLAEDAAVPTSSDDEHDLLKMLKAADLLDAYIKCLSELSSGNREFAVAKKQTEDTLARLAIPEVDWFLEHMAPSFSKTLDELSEND
ncbi:5'-deoxynucleotidase [Paenibacillus spongiae]|uniref:5'-deoxynucleotidase n=1 Tax=Paenibacillus spongiae TaxID=2909671 RepID=A0ABY5S3U5_9BACL|nr:5'-deoxynucleotidase [Paenibacillus spongiae]UVI28582.1 5'-deoxynucleotidase [Paenibacillus spongiae]